jgi:hypothetical protein
MEAATTREAAQVLDASPTDALKLLKAANIRHRTIRSGGRIHQYLWDAEEVQKLRQVLQEEVKGGADAD